MMTTILNDISAWRARRLMMRSRYREQFYDLPDGVYTHWAHSASTEFPGIPRDALFFARSAETLLEFFECIAFSGKPCALPSKAADSVWHAWLRHSPSTLQKFCLKHYQRHIPHLEAAAMPGPMDEALANCLVTGRRLAGVVAGSPHLPLLFSADRRLRMPHGYGYRMVGTRVGVADLDARGRALHESFPTSLTTAALLSAGMVEEWEVPAAPRAPTSSSAEGGGADIDCGDSGDSGGDGGDGGGCGSGCCGGCGGS